uniref:Tafazzin family protein n=1 Tax=Phallusia mammillata TaxID=59560 RepID=A0A6F9DTR7_9ASCI|nr:tafazzin-like [Phallusia mammillata]
METERMKSIVRWPFPKEPHPLWWRCSSSVTMTAVATLSKIWLCYLNSTKVYRSEVFNKLVAQRTPEMPLITVCNHHSCMDDPLFAGALDWKTIFQPRKLRWMLGAHDICFSKPWHAFFFGLGKTFPVVRGDGVFQRGMDSALAKLNQNEWVHVFPEGKVNMDKTWIRLKWGVGRLISECKKTPLVLPMYHLGIDDILPNTKPYLPKIGKKVTILIGHPIDFGDQLKKAQQLGLSAKEIRKSVTDIIQDELEKLRIETQQLHEAR